MTDLILCLVAMIMVVWILLLMSENRTLKAERNKLRNELLNRLEKSGVRVEISAGRKLTTAELGKLNQQAGRNR